MHGSEVRLNLFDGAPLEYRFASPQWRSDRRPVPWDDLVAAVRALNPRRCQRLLFSDTPLAHPRFFDLVAEARALGLKGLAVVSDAPPLADAGVLDALAEAGVEKVFAMVGGGRPLVHDRVMHDAGSFAAAIEGLRLASASKLELYVLMPVLRGNEREVEPLLDWLVAHAKPQGFLLALPEVSRTPEGLRKLLLPYGELARLAARVFSACARAKVEYGFAQRRALPPCAAKGAMDRFGTFFFDRLDYLRHADRADFERVEACASCSLHETCPGVERDYLEQFGRAGFDPVSLAVSMDWKLKQVNKLERRDFKNVSDFETDDKERARSLIRINGHCNMSCSFCFVDRTVPDFEAEQILGEIDRMADRSLAHMVLSGGEPTLHPALPRFIARARERGFRTIEIQSNGVRPADFDYMKTLVDAGLNKATYSLHSVDPAHSDKITRLPGGFAKTMAAIHNSRRLGVLTQVAHVITRSNYQELPRTVRFLRAEFPEHEGHLSICFGVAQPISDLVYTWVMPRFDEIKPFMREALDHCLDTRVGFGGMIGQGGYPPCMLDGEMKYYAGNLRNIYRSPDYGDQFVKPPKCGACSFEPYCVGVRRIYVETYGDEEIRPFTADLDAMLPEALRPLPPTTSTERSAIFAHEHEAPLVQLRARRDGHP